MRRLAVFLFLFLQLPVHALDGLVLRDVADRVVRLKHQGETPVVIFDLDDTLLDSRGRMIKILREFVAQPSIPSRFPLEVQKVLQIRREQLKYRLQDTLEARGIHSAAFLKEGNAFVGRRMYSGVYVAGDEPIPGAVEYVKALQNRGALIVYLTARNRPNLETATLTTLRRYQFPLGDDTRLLMTPSSSTPTLEHKVGSLPGIRRLGTVVAVFENEPGNLNAMAGHLPGAILVFVETMRSDPSLEPLPQARWVKDFLSRD